MKSTKILNRATFSELQETCPRWECYIKSISALGTLTTPPDRNRSFFFLPHIDCLILFSDVSCIIFVHFKILFRWSGLWINFPWLSRKKKFFRSIREAAHLKIFILDIRIWEGKMLRRKWSMENEVDVFNVKLLPLSRESKIFRGKRERIRTPMLRRRANRSGMEAKSFGERLAREW